MRWIESSKKKKTQSMMCTQESSRTSIQNMMKNAIFSLLYGGYQSHKEVLYMWACVGALLHQVYWFYVTGAYMWACVDVLLYPTVDCIYFGKFIFHILVRKEAIRTKPVKKCQRKFRMCYLMLLFRCIEKTASCWWHHDVVCATILGIQFPNIITSVWYNRR